MSTFRDKVLNEIDTIAREYYGVSIDSPDYFSDGDLSFILKVLANNVFTRKALVDAMGGDPEKVIAAVEKVEEDFRKDNATLAGWLTGDRNGYKDESPESSEDPKFKEGYQKGREEGYSEGYDEGYKNAQEDCTQD
jgi:flagellar biosynthesis/type III secretory pathway protein FliH